MEEEKKDGYDVYFSLLMGIMIANPNRMVSFRGGAPSTYSSDTTKRHTTSSTYSPYRSIFGFSNDLGTDIAIASLLYF